jgi:RNA polymerase sigma-70 factor (ECF subfamily)
VSDRPTIHGQGTTVVLAPDVQKRLVTNCIAGDRKAQKELYDAYAPFVFGVIRRYLYNTEAAQEVLNDTFYRVFTKLHQYGFKGAFEGWIRRIAINLITDNLRQHGKYEKEIATDADTINAYVDESIVSKLGYKELLNVVHQLPDTHRLVFNLYVFEDLAHKEIAVMLDMTEGNSRWHLNDARRKLKEKIYNLK